MAEFVTMKVSHLDLVTLLTQVGTNIKDGGRWAMVGVATREQGEAIIKALHLLEVKGREITVKWKEEGMWACPDPTCGKSNFDIRDDCVRCGLNKIKFAKIRA